MQLLDVEDMVKMATPDWKCVFMYVLSIYRAFVLPKQETNLSNVTTARQWQFCVPLRAKQAMLLNSWRQISLCGNSSKAFMKLKMQQFAGICDPLLKSELQY